MSERYCSLIIVVIGKDNFSIKYQLCRKIFKICKYDLYNKKLGKWVEV